MSIYHHIRVALADNDAVEGAKAAHKLLLSWCDHAPRLPGCGTIERLALRIHRGFTIEEAAAREYSYRWLLPIKSWVNHAEAKSRSRPVTGAWPVPHAIGM